MTEGMTRTVPTTLLVVILMGLAGYAALFVAPDERTMHEAQRIFYFHVPCWIAMFVMFFICLLGNVAYLTTRAWKWDWLAAAAGEVGVVCCSIGLITGSLWGRPAWGIWWTWDARLTTTFILWLLYICYFLLRGTMEDGERRARISAVFGIFAFLDVPLVYVSNRLWRTQHPAPVFFGGPDAGMDPTMGKVLLLCAIAVLGITVLLLFDRYRLERLGHELGQLAFEIESRRANQEQKVLRES